MAFSARDRTGATMTEEATDAPAAPAESMAPEQTEAETNASLKKKFRTITGEEILRHTRPSFMAFFGYYILGLVMMGLVELLRMRYNQQMKQSQLIQNQLYLHVVKMEMTQNMDIRELVILHTILN